jgi:hypothetical protein
LDYGHGIALDGAGNAYVTGDTTSPEGDFPVLGGPDLTQNGNYDTFIAKVNAAGTALVYSGFIGGSGDDLRARVDVDGAGNAYVVGTTDSLEATFPVTLGPDLTYNGGTYDGFVAKVNAAGTALVYAGFLGGSGEDWIRAVAVDGSNNAVVVGWTASTQATFPVMLGPDATYNGGAFDAFVAKVNAAGTALLECGYIGGSGDDRGAGVAIDGANNIYVSGLTTSTQATFPEIVGPLLNYNGGTSDGFMAKMNAVTTAVTLASFEAVGLDSAVDLRWATGSELSNLGFHLYRAPSAEGPYERITLRLVPGLGSSPAGASYRYRDEGLVNGLSYFYKLEDVETTGRTMEHGPVAATPIEGAAPVAAPTALLTYGQSEAASFEILERSPGRLVLQLRVKGFSAQPMDDGSVSISVPGFSDSESGAFSIPVKRSWVEVGSGRNLRVGSVVAEGVEEFSSLRPAPGQEPEIVATRQGTVRAGRKARGARAGKATATYPEEMARILSAGYQQETRKALLELAPLRWDPAGARLLLARTLTVEIRFEGRDETRHRESNSHDTREVIARLGARAAGLYAVSFEDVLGRARRRPVPASSLRLSRLGEPVAFHLEPDRATFGPGSTIYFLSGGEALNPYERRAMYELERRGGGARMPLASAAPDGAALPFLEHCIDREENRYYQAGLLEADDLWLWDTLLAPTTRSYPFALRGVLSSEPAEVEVRIQGVSDLPESPDHHLRLWINGVAVGESTLEGKTGLRLTAEISPGTLLDGENRLEIENVGDTGASYSMVMLDRFSVRYARLPEADAGHLEGSFRETGTAEVSGFSGGALVVDVSADPPRWLKGVESADGMVRFRAEAARSYALVSPGSLLKADVLNALPGLLKKDRRQTDYLVIGPPALLEAARPLIARRRAQGLRTRAVSIEQIYSEFGFGERRPEAVREFLTFSYHYWGKPSPRYVLLLGDASYDFKDYLGTGVTNHLPSLAVKTSYLWTASDPAYAAVNGDDILPDLAIGRLPAANPEELTAMVDKILAYESSGSLSSGPMVLVADDADAAGDFEADAEEIASTLLPAAAQRKIYLGRLGTEQTRAEIADAFDQGASLLSYMGHGGIHLWASENLFDTSGVAGLGPQDRMPLVLTLNCLNGYFHFPYFDSLAEELVKAEGRGAIAAVSPSGLSLNEPAHQFHKALLAELLSGDHARLGDALSAAQAEYAADGAFPELISIYHLFGDPALPVR